MCPYTRSLLLDLLVDVDQFLFGEDHRHGIQGIGLVVGVLRESGQVFVQDLPLAADLVADRHLLVEIFDRVDKGVRLVGDGITLDADEVGKLCELLMRRLAVCAQYDGQKHRAFYRSYTTDASGNHVSILTDTHGNPLTEFVSGAASPDLIKDMADNLEEYRI